MPYRKSLIRTKDEYLAPFNQRSNIDNGCYRDCAKNRPSHMHVGTSCDTLFTRRVDKHYVKMALFSRIFHHKRRENRYNTTKGEDNCTV